MATMDSDGELPNGIPTTSQPADEQSSANGAPYSGLSGVPSHFRSDRVDPSVASYKIRPQKLSAQCIQCFQCRQPETPGDSGHTDDADENSGGGGVTKMEPF